jgi:SAF domain-containing protein
LSRDVTAAPADRIETGGLGAAAVVAALPRQRSNRMLFLGIAIVGLGALVGWFAFTSLNKQVPVIIATRDIPVGTVLSSGDLGTSLVSADSQVVTIPGRQLKALVGTVAATDLRKGSALVPSQVTTALSPAIGQSLVAVALKSSQLPARGLKTGDRVLVVATPGQGGQGGAATTDKPLMDQPVAATVDRTSSVGTQGTVVVDLIVESAASVSVSQQASTGLFSLILQPRAS